MSLIMRYSLSLDEKGKRKENRSPDMIDRVARGGGGKNNHRGPARSLFSQEVRAFFRAHRCGEGKGRRSPDSPDLL